MAIAIYIKSESCDKYIYAYDTGTPLETIKNELMANMENFRPMSEWEIDTSESSNDVATDLYDVMDYVFNKSWEKDYQ
ncbi:hypothetical protein CPT_Muldoon_120 [Serratia phage Muldoon]|uniref:Uncharacterized protein n=1 Tax=Serratia phage Muldoon TaxID=2601678 RepID=A0A5P8PHE2_9CAUD|nr:hypothetical protein HYP94_gp119 [Serratia phage Muldoon]QFR56075.1 hypothetical protein CPT_Muldoon_120 [Serratia phage Muldoon]UNA02482.1 hypothetical protein [Serratia phage SP1]WDS61666.1 hypothetical protein [Cronobacter phage vB_Cdu_VP8]